MKTSQLITLAAMVLSTGAAVAADVKPEVTKALTTYTDDFVVPTYSAMATGAVELVKATEALVAKSTNTNIGKVVAAYKKTRTPWEQSESFLFGPAEYANLDPKLDSWPLDQVQLDTFLMVVASGKIKVDAAYVSGSLGAALRGFHAAEYLLFRDGKVRTSNMITRAERNYLAAVARVIAEDAIQLEALWAGYDSLSADKKAILEAAEIEKDGSYAAELKGAGTAGSRYETQQDAIEEIFTGCADIVTELAGPKFGEPFEAQDAKLFESWYSHTSLVDTRDNVISVQKAYGALSPLVAAKDQAADAAVKAAFTKVFACMDAFKKPLAKSLGEKKLFANVIAACEELNTAMGKAQEVLLGK